MVDCNYHDMSQIVNIWKFTLLNDLEYDGQSDSMVDCNDDMSQIVNIWKFTLLNAVEYDGQSLEVVLTYG